MRPRTIWIIVACIILVPALLLVIAAEWLFGVTELLYKPIRYRVATSVELIDHSTPRSSVANSDCWALVSTRGMVRGIRKSRKGEDNHAVLGDGSILILPDLDPCRWIDAKPAPGTSYVLMPPNAPISLSPPSGRGSGTAQSTAELRPGETWRFDSVRDPTSVTIYQLAALLQQEDDGLQIKSATISAIGAGSSNDVAYTLEDRFPWFRDVPRGDALKDYDRYWQLHHHGNFLGFRASVTQLVGGSRCHAYDPNAEGPIVIPMQSPCTFVNACERGDNRVFCGKLIGWLTGAASSDFGELAFASADPSTAKVAVLYREPVLMQAGARGDRSQPSLRWKPRICLDGLCVEGDVAATGIPQWTQFYYPARNQFVTIWPLSFYAAGAFRRTGASH